MLSSPLQAYSGHLLGYRIDSSLQVCSKSRCVNLSSFLPTVLDFCSIAKPGGVGVQRAWKDGLMPIQLGWPWRPASAFFSGVPWQSHAFSAPFHGNKCHGGPGHKQPSGTPVNTGFTPWSHSPFFLAKSSRLPLSFWFPGAPSRAILVLWEAHFQMCWHPLLRRYVLWQRTTATHTAEPSPAWQGSGCVFHMGSYVPGHLKK